MTRDATKFDHVVTALPADALNVIQNIIRMPRATPDRYERLKSALQLTFGKTPAQRHVELIQYASAKEPILDVKPSNMLMHIRDLSGDSKAAFERAVLLNRLPSSVRTTLSTSATVNNEEWALEANQVMEAFLLARPGCTPASVMAMENMAPVPPPLPLAAPQAVEVAAVDSRRRGGGDAAFLCFYHAKFGTKAYSCKSNRCPMRGQVQRRPQQSSASGNGRAGR